MGHRRPGHALSGGSVRIRPGHSRYAGRSYRLRHRGLHRHHHGGYYYRWYDPRRLRYPYYRHYGPDYGLYFGFGLSYYPATYETYFVDAVPYYGPGMVVEEEIVASEPYVVSDPGVVVAPDAVPYVAPQPEVAPSPEAFPDPAPVEEDAPGPDAPVESGKPHADFQPGVDAFMSGDYWGSLERFARVLQAEPDNGEAWLALLHANFALGRYPAAAQALSEAASLDAFPRGYRFDPHPLYPGKLSFDQAFANLKAQVAATPKDADLQLLLAYFHMAVGERAPAQTAVQRALEIRPADETAPRLSVALLPPPPPPSQDAK